MNVKLVSLTQSMVAGENLTAEELLVYIARVSNPSNQLNTSTSDKLIAYMIKNKHWSPFDMVNLTVEVTTSRAIAQQILRHWSIKPQEFSQRYAEAVNFEPIELRKNGATNRQSSSEVFNPEIMIKNNVETFPMEAQNAVQEHTEQSYNLYKSLLEADVAKECARMVLPLTTSTTLYLNGSVRSWIHYIEQRTDLHAQLEHRMVALEILEIFKTYFPMTFKAIEDSKPQPTSIMMVKEFHETFGHGIAIYPIVPEASVVDFRVDFIKKEANELLAGAVVNDFVEVADGLGDIQYVLDGFFLECGLHHKKDAIMAEIHRSNMSKGCVNEEEAIATIENVALNQGGLHSDYEFRKVGDIFVVYRLKDNKVMKSINYSQPNLSPIIYGS